MSDFESEEDVKLSNLSVMDIDTKYFDLPSSSSVTMPVNGGSSNRIVSPTDCLSNAESTLPLILTSEYFIIVDQIDTLCCVAKVWTEQQISFLGYTCHWIESSYKRKSVALACRRLNGPHTYNKIAGIVNEINTQFGITESKLACTVIDDDSNFMKEEFGNRHVGECEEDLKFDPSGAVFQVSKHVKCASHALNLLATVDLLEALERIPHTFEKHQQSMKKCTLIWNNCNQPELAERLDEILTAPIIRPVVIRLNSLYEATKQLLSLSFKLHEITNIIGVDKFERSDIEYLEEYCQFMQPIAEGLDFLQKEEHIYFGYLAPTLLTLKAKLHKLANSPIAKYLTTVAKHMEDALIERFRSFFEMQPSSHDAVIAAMTCPTVKIMNCVKLIKIWKETAPNCTASLLQDIFVNEVISNSPRTDTRSDKRKSPELTAHPFFILEDSDEDELIQLQSDRKRECGYIIEELRNFMENGKSSMDSLNNYPLIKLMFYKYNTALPSSAPVERLYCFGEMVNEYSCQHLSNVHFEKMVLVQNNKIIV